MRKIILAVIFAFVLAPIVRADTIVLKNGETIKGKIIEQTANRIVVDVSGSTLTYFFDEIQSLTPDSDAGQTVPETASNRPLANGPVDQRLIREAFELLDIKNQLQGFVEDGRTGVKEQFSRLQDRLAPDQIKQSEQMVDKIYDLDRLYDEMINIFAKAYDEKYLQEFLSWLKSPDYQKMVQIENTGIAGFGQGPEFEDFRGKIQNNDAALEKQSYLAVRLDAATEASKTMIDVITEMSTVTLKEMNAVLPADRQATPEQLDQIKQITLDQMKTLKETVLLTTLYTYRNVQEEEMLRYISAYESPAGQWFTKAFNASLKQVMIDATEELTRKYLAFIRDVAAQQRPQ